jgi:hypothetical protein
VGLGWDLGARPLPCFLFSVCAHAVLLPLSGAELGGGQLLARARSAFFGLVFPRLSMGTLAALPRARPRGVRIPRCQLARGGGLVAVLPLSLGPCGR